MIRGMAEALVPATMLGRVRKARADAAARF